MNPVDHSEEKRWLMYGSDLDAQLSPLTTGLIVVVVLVCILLTLYIVREYGPVIVRLVRSVGVQRQFPWVCSRQSHRRRPVGGSDDQLRSDIRALSDAVASLVELPSRVGALEMAVRESTDMVAHLRGEVAGATDAAKAIVREAAEHHRDAARAIRQESERIHRVDEKLSRIIAVLPPGGHG